jgi:hypothetical protein
VKDIPFVPLVIVDEILFAIGNKNQLFVKKSARNVVVARVDALSRLDKDFLLG